MIPPQKRSGTSTAKCHSAIPTMAHTRTLMPSVLKTSGPAQWGRACILGQRHPPGVARPCEASVRCVVAWLRFRCSGACSPRTRASWCSRSSAWCSRPSPSPCRSGASEAARARRRAWSRCWSPIWSCCVRRSLRSIIWPRPCAGMTRWRRGRAPRCSGGPVVVALAQTFNDMLDRLESERRESARQALLVQEAERRRIARELHDEVGQTLTGVMLQIEGLAASIPDELRGQLDELRETARHGTEEVRRIARRLRPDALEELGLQALSPRWPARSSARRVCPCPATARAGCHGLAGRGVGDLPRGAGGADECRPPCRGDVGAAASCATRETGSS